MIYIRKTAKVVALVICLSVVATLMVWKRQGSTTQTTRTLRETILSETERTFVEQSRTNKMSTNSYYNTIHTNYSTSRKGYNRVAFLKVHKAGSSTAQNIFLRYGESRNLTFVISKHREGQYDNVISTATSMNTANTLPPPPNKTFDVLCCHVLYNKETFDKYMPNDTAYIGIIREPFEQFLSTLNYFRVKNIFVKIKADNPVLVYLQEPVQYERGISRYHSFTNNRMATEFDFPASLYTNYSKQESLSYLEKLDREFQLVIILEHFTESVVLMRRLLGWKIKDILYLKKNVARKDYSFVDYTHRYLYERFAKLDYDLYNYFYKRLWDRIRLEGDDFHLELLYFNRLRKEVEDYCTDTKNRYVVYQVNASSWGDAFSVDASDCNFLKMHESKFVNMIRTRQYGSINST